MKALIQRVHKASVQINNEIVSSIGKGLCIFIGIHVNDNKNDIEYMIKKIINLRIFEDCDGKRWQKSVKDMNLEILCVSQFTLYCDLKGNKPDYRHNMKGDDANQFYDLFLSTLKKCYAEDLIKDGQFGAKMNVELINDGPVTIALESPQKVIT